MRYHQQPDQDIISDYQRVLDRVYCRSVDLIPAAPTWQAGLYQSVRACYTEMRADPQALHLHFVATARDPEVLRTRTRHRDRLLALLDRTRDDAPAPVHAELLLSMIHTALLDQITSQATPPDLDSAERTFASLLFHYAPVSH